MEATLPHEIKALLSELFVVDYAFREEIKERISGLSNSELQQLKSVLQQALAYQQQLLLEKMQADPALYDRLMAIENSTAQELQTIYADFLKEQDKNKLAILLNKIKNI